MASGIAPGIAPGMDLGALGAVELRDPDRSPHRLGDYWSDRDVVLVFLRHFG